MSKSQTAGDFARAKVLRQGGSYFSDVLAEVQQTLHGLTHRHRAAYAVWCADALMRYHEQLPATSQRPFTLSWRPVLNAIVLGLESDWDSAVRAAQSALDTFHGSPYNHADGQDGPDDADDDPAAASIYAADCAITGNAQSAFWCASRLVDLAFALVPDESRPAISPGSAFPAGESLATDCLNPEVQRVLRIVKAAADQLQAIDPTTAVVDQLPKLTLNHNHGP